MSNGCSEKEWDRDAGHPQGEAILLLTERDRRLGERRGGKIDVCTRDY